MAWYRGTGKENHQSVFENVATTVAFSVAMTVPRSQGLISQ
jgi:hypothetical protein